MTKTKTAASHILLVENNTLAIMAVGLALKKLGCVIDVVEKGAQAIEKAKNGVYDLILTDIDLSDMTGIDVTKAIRSFPDKQKSQVPIVAITEHAGNAERQQACLDVGMQGVLNKPAQPLLLVSVLKRFVFHQTDGKPRYDKSEIFAKNEENEPNLAIIDWAASVRMCGGSSNNLRDGLSFLNEELKDTKHVFAKYYPERNLKVLREELERCIDGIVYLCLPQLEHTLKAFQAVVETQPPDWDECDCRYIDVQKAMEDFWHGYKDGGFERNLMGKDHC